MCLKHKLQPCKLTFYVDGRGGGGDGLVAHHRLPVEGVRGAGGGRGLGGGDGEAPPHGPAPRHAPAHLVQGRGLAAGHPHLVLGLLLLLVCPGPGHRAVAQVVVVAVGLVVVVARCRPAAALLAVPLLPPRSVFVVGVVLHSEECIV